MLICWDAHGLFIYCLLLYCIVQASSPAGRLGHAARMHECSRITLDDLGIPKTTPECSRPQCSPWVNGFSAGVSSCLWGSRAGYFLRTLVGQGQKRNIIANRKGTGSFVTRSQTLMVGFMHSVRGCAVLEEVVNNLMKPKKVHVG